MRSPRLLYCWKLAASDPERTRRIIGGIPILSQSFETPAYLALSEVGRDEAAVRRLMDEARQRADLRMNEPPNGFEPNIGDVLPIAERIDAALVPEFLWREAASRPSFDNPRTMRDYAAIAPIDYLAWYDREAAAAMFEPSRARIEQTDERELARWRSEFLAWSYFDPRGAVARLEKVPVAHDPATDAHGARLAVAGSLGLSYEQRLRTIWGNREYVLDSTRPGP